jgi:hypothetical protein
MSIDSLTSSRPGWYVLLAAVLGALELGLSRLLAAGPLASAVGLIVSLAVLASTALAGAGASRQGQRPGWAGALPGLAYGVVSGIGVFFQHTTLAQAQVLWRHESASVRSKLTPEQLMQEANGLATHLVQFLVGALLLALFGIIVGSLAGALTRRYLQRNAGQGG